MKLADLFPNETYRFQMRFERGRPAEFFAPTANHDELIAQRRHWLREAPAECTALLPEGIPLLEETIDLASDWQGFAKPDEAAPAQDKCRSLGEFWEPDWLLLKADANGEMRLRCACVCFPSSWRLSEKIGRPIETIHGVVPGLNPSIGEAIHTFLSRLKPDIAWQRTNWGLSRSAELNQHPDRNLPKLDDSVRIDEVWLRVEHQALIALPRTEGILFGIRIAVHSLSDVRADKEAGLQLRRVLETMPEELARYKGIEPARAAIIRMLG